MLSLSGELDISVRDPIERQLRDDVDAVSSAVIIVDLSAVSFMDMSEPDEGRVTDLEQFDSHAR